MDTPREVMFDAFHKTWGISNKDLASAIVLDEAVTSGKSPRELIEVRSTLSRLVVHVKPGEGYYGWIAPFEQCIYRTMALVKASRKPHANADIITALTGAHAARMRAALDAYGEDGALFANMAARVSGSTTTTPADSAELALALFVVAGCTGDARQAAEYTLGLAQRLAQSAMMRTKLAGSTDDATQPPANAPVSHLGLYRIQDGMLMGSPHRLSLDAEGTEVGSMSLARNSINDVGEGVSRRHLRIWCDASGKWLAQGLGSTNGTLLLRERGKRVVVEPPRAYRDRDYVASAVPIHAGDRLILASTTEFAVVALPAE